MDKQKEVKNKEIKEIKPRYNEKIAIKEFLNSEKGIHRLLDRIVKSKEDCTPKKKKPLIECIDEIIDFYVAWIYKCPAKSFYRKSYYKMFKKIEKLCGEKEFQELFDYII